MKKKLLGLVPFFLCAALLNACSQSHDESKKSSETAPESFVDLSEITDGSFQTLPEPVPVLATTATVKSASIEITLKNTSTTAPYALTKLLLQPSDGFSIKTNRCSSTLAAKASCKITIAFSNRSLFDGTYGTGLEINDAVLPLSASVTGQPDPDNSGTPELELTLDSSFDPIGAIPYRTLTIKNIGTGTAKDVALSLPSSYALRIQRCPSSLKPKASCEMQVILKNHRIVVTPPVENISVGATGVPPVVVGSNGSSTPPVTLSPVKEMFLNSQFALVWKNDGSLINWGSQTYPQSVIDDLGITSSNPIKKIYSHNQASGATAILLNDGSVKVFGNPTSGGNQAQVDEINFNSSNMVKEFYSNGQSIIALLTNGQAKIWGSASPAAGRGSQAELDAITDPIKDIYPNNVGYILVGENKKIKFIGNYILGFMYTMADWAPLNIEKVYAANQNLSVAVLDDGSIRAWGQNYFDEFSPAISAPVKFGIATGNSVILALTNNEVRSFSSFQLPQSLFDAVNFPSLSPIKKMAATSSAVAILLEDGTIKVFGDNFGGTQSQVDALDLPSKGSPVKDIHSIQGGFMAVLEDKRVFVWGNASYGANQSQVEALNLQTLSPIKKVYFNQGGTVMVLLENGKIKQWGGSGAIPLYNPENIPTEFQ